MKCTWNITSLPQNEAALPSYENCLQKLKQADFYVTNDINRQIPENAESWQRVVGTQI